MHIVKNIAPLTSDLHSEIIAKSNQLMCKNSKIQINILGIDYHHHIEIRINNTLRNIHDADIMVGEIGTYLGYNADFIFTDYCNDGFFHLYHYLTGYKYN